MTEWNDERPIYDEQFTYIEREFGKNAAGNANYGWGVAADDTHVSIATKVYGHGILVSERHKGERRIHHEFRGTEPW